LLTDDSSIQPFAGVTRQEGFEVDPAGADDQ
jgi:hypothetical protein